MGMREGGGGRERELTLLHHGCGIVEHEEDPARNFIANDYQIHAKYNILKTRKK